MKISVGLPVDKDGGVRRNCPFCNREFKIVMTEGELKSLIQKALDSFLVAETREAAIEQSDSSQEQRFCPYCCQKASSNDWWTQSQSDLFMDIAGNLAINELNKFSKELERSNQPSSAVKFKANRINTNEPRHLQEPDDMEIFELVCCDQKIKLDENWSDIIHCFYCGFPHAKRS